MKNWRILIYCLCVFFALLSIGFFSKLMVITFFLMAFAILLALELFKYPTKKTLPKEDLDKISNVQNFNMGNVLDVYALANTLPDSLFLLDKNHAIVYLNTMAMKNFPTIKAKQNYLTSFRAPEIIKTIRKTQNSKQTMTLDYLDKKNNERFFQITFVPLENEYIFAIMRDNTQTRLLDRMRSDFIANASHELRTPLTSLRGFIETIKGPAKDDEKAREKFLTIMQEQSERMARLIDDLLSLSKLEMKTGLHANAKINLNSLLKHVVESLNPLAQNLNVTLNMTLPKKDILIFGDEDECIQLFQNLIENACKYGQSGEKVEITAKIITSKSQQKNQENEQDEVMITIKDYGQGISEEHIPRLTERFYRANTSASQKHKGTGLGLAIVKHILTHHHGRLIINSTLGKGATFKVILPLKNNWA